MIMNCTFDPSTGEVQCLISYNINDLVTSDLSELEIDVLDVASRSNASLEDRLEGLKTIARVLERSRDVQK